MTKSLSAHRLPPTVYSYPIVIGLVLVDSLHYVFGRLLLPYLPPVTSAMYVLLVGTFEVMIFLGIRREELRLVVFRRHVWLFLSVGFLVAASTSLSYSSVAFIDPGTASLLNEMSVLFSLAFSLLWLRERLTAWQGVGALVAIGGVVLINFQPGDYLWLGSLLVLGSALMYALHAALVKRYGSDIRLAEFFMFRLLSTSGFLLLFNLSQGSLPWPAWPGPLLLLLAGTVDVAISRALYYLALNRLRLSMHTLVLTLSPVVAILWSLALFGTRPSLQQLLGGLAVLVGVVIVTTRRA